MKLSFVIPAHNEEKLIGQCLEAVLLHAGRSGVSTEVIVVNNASTDHTREVAARYPNVRIIDEPRKGLARARQSGFEASSGELVANIDADTLVSDAWIATVLRMFSRNSSLVGLSGPHFFYDVSPFRRLLTKLFYLIAYANYILDKHILKVSSFMQGGNFVVRRDALLKVGGFNPSYTFYGEDADIAKRLFPVGDVRFTFALPLKASGRRLEMEGYFRMAARYIANHLSTIFFHHAITHTRTEFASANHISRKTRLEAFALLFCALAVAGTVTILRFSTRVSADEHPYLKKTIEKIKLQQQRAAENIKELYTRATADSR